MDARDSTCSLHCPNRSVKLTLKSPPSNLATGRLQKLNLGCISGDSLKRIQREGAETTSVLKGYINCSPRMGR